MHQATQCAIAPTRNPRNGMQKITGPTLNVHVQGGFPVERWVSVSISRGMSRPTLLVTLRRVPGPTELVYHRNLRLMFRDFKPSRAAATRRLRKDPCAIPTSSVIR